MVNVFLTPSEKAKLTQWKYSVVDNSITTQIFTPFWEYLVTFFPKTVAPNIISLVGLLCTLYSWYLSHNYADSYHMVVSIACVILTFTYFCLDAVDGKHARKTGQSSPLGELFDHSCDNIGSTFMMLTLTNCLGITNFYTQWYFIQTAQLLFLDCHITAFCDRVVRFGRFIGGPGEFLVVYMATIMWNAVFGFQFVNYADNLFGYSLDELGQFITLCVYYFVFCYMILKTIRLKNHYSTKAGLLISFFTRMIPSLLIYVGLGFSKLDHFTLISNGLIMSILTGDIIVSKMASRELHPWVPVMLFFSLFDNFFCLLMTAAYYSTVLSEISQYLRKPILGINTRVFCNGVFDLCHINHMNLFDEASTYGTYLIVGVHSDEDVAKYKGKTTMTHDERCEAVNKQHHVDEVVRNCPLILTEEFIKEHRIDLVVCSSEYDNVDDEYYHVARKLGILYVLHRFDGMSTSELKKRIRDADK
jgi:cytidyltransferase-like protein